MINLYIYIHIFVKRKTIRLVTPWYTGIHTALWGQNKFFHHNSYTYSNSWNQDISRWRSTMGNLWVETLLIQGWYRLTSHSPFKEILKRKQTRALEKPLIIMLFERVLSIFWWKLGLKYPAFCASFGHFSLHTPSGSRPTSSLGGVSSNTCCTNPSSLPICL